MDNQVSLGVEGAKESFSAQAVTMVGQGETLAVDATVECYVEKGTGFLSVTDSTNDNSSVFSVHLSSGVAVVGKSNGDASFSDAKDTASKINVYVEGGKIIVQNKLAAETIVNVKAYI